MKKWFITLLFILCTGLVFAEPITEEQVDILIDGESMTFETPPILINNQAMVPMRPFFEALGTQVGWLEETRTVTAYKNNMFIKLQIDNATAYKNGKAFQLKSPPIIRDNRTLVPAQFIAETFDMHSKWVNDHQIDFESDTDIPQYYRFGDYFYKQQSINQYGVSFSIPNYWDVLDAKQYLYGIQSTRDVYTIQFSRHNSEETDTLDSFYNVYRQSLIDLYGDIVTLSNPTAINYNNLNGYTFKSTVEMQDQTQYHVYYLFYDQNNGYLFKCTYYNKQAEKELADIFTNVVSTFQIDRVSVDSTHEHYVEYPNYYALGFNLEQEIHSNMEVRNAFTFSGTIQSKDINPIYIRVSKGSESMYFSADIDAEGRFKAKVYTPFGLGKHDVCIMTTKDDCMNSTSGIMQFSIINLSSDKIRYIIPSEQIASDNEYIVSQANLITYKVPGDYSKAKGIYDWITTEIQIEDSSSTDSTRNAEQVYFEKKGTSEEIAHLYAAMLRAVEIPTRVVSGTITEVQSTHYWTEININGQWVLSDPAYAIRYGNIDVVNQALYANYFRLSTDHYSGLFNTITTAQY